jgi:phospholipid/cholesterol/gamma-HCH transport system ATP-binding protein
MIIVERVSKKFGSQHVLRDVSITIEDNKITAIVGPSGVGKSVLLKLILGIMAPESGRIQIGKYEITSARNENEKNRMRDKVAVLFQSAALLDSETIYDNIAFPLRIRGRFATTVINRKVSDLLDSLSLTELAYRYPQEVSIGCRKRVGLARALITEPEIVLFDEPNTGLDPLVGQEVYDLIRETHREYGYTGVVISHELPEVFQVSDKVVMLLGGKPIFEGTPDEMISSNIEAVTQFLNGRIEGPISIS